MSTQKPPEGYESCVVDSHAQSVVEYDRELNVGEDGIRLRLPAGPLEWGSMRSGWELARRVAALRERVACAEQHLAANRADIKPSTHPDWLTRAIEGEEDPATQDAMAREWQGMRAEVERLTARNADLLGVSEADALICSGLNARVTELEAAFQTVREACPPYWDDDIAEECCIANGIARTLDKVSALQAALDAAREAVHEAHTMGRLYEGQQGSNSMPAEEYRNVDAMFDRRMSAARQPQEPPSREWLRKAAGNEEGLNVTAGDMNTDQPQEPMSTAKELVEQASGNNDELTARATKALLPLVEALEGFTSPSYQNTGGDSGIGYSGTLVYPAQVEKLVESARAALRLANGETE